MRKIIVADTDSGLTEIHRGASSGHREILTGPTVATESTYTPQKREFLVENHGPQKPTPPRPVRNILP